MMVDRAPLRIDRIQDSYADAKQFISLNMMFREQKIDTLGYVIQRVLTCVLFIHLKLLGS
ncbi:hypothetical protein D3C78_1766830 [compost metagenome]